MFGGSIIYSSLLGSFFILERIAVIMNINIFSIKYIVNITYPPVLRSMPRKDFILKYFFITNIYYFYYEEKTIASGLFAKNLLLSILNALFLNVLSTLM